MVRYKSNLFLYYIKSEYHKMNYSLICDILSGAVHTKVEVRRMDLWNDLGFSLCTALSVCCIVATSDDGEKSKMEVSADWCIAVEHQRSSSIRVYLHRLSD